MNLDKELAELARPERTFNEQIQQKQKINERYKHAINVQLWVQGAVMTCITALFLILFFQTDNITVPQTQQAMLTDELKEITILLNHVPERHLNLNSPMYISKRSTTDHGVLATFQSLLTAEKLKVEETSGQFLFPEYSNVYDLLLKFENGKELYLKYSTNYLFDPNKEVLYEFSPDLRNDFYNIIPSIYYEKADNNWKFYALLCFLIIFIFDVIFIGGKFYIKDENGNNKKRNGTINFLIFLIFLIPLFYSRDWIGTTHLGLVLLGLILSFVLGEYYDVKKGIKRPNWIWAFFTLINIIVICVIIVL